MKVTIPKHILDDLVNRFGCTQEEAAKAYLKAQDTAGEAFNTTLEETLGKPEGRPAIDLKEWTPAELKEHLDKYVIGQEQYKLRLCIAAAYHFAMIKHLHQHPEDARIKRFRKKNTLIAGPSGSGKTYCVEVLGDVLQVPTLIIDSTDYTESGYVGKSADDMIRELIDMAPGNNRSEQVQFVAENGGIIFIDEIDKKAKDGSLIGADISREGFQRTVLKLMERKLVPVDNPLSPVSQIQEAMSRSRGGPVKKDKMINTENVLFILGGSFERNVDRLESLIKKRIEHKGNLKEDGSVVVRGFGTTAFDGDKDSYRNYLQYADADDYIRFGLLPELVGRAPIRTFVNLLSKNDLIRIMTDTEDSILTQYQIEMGLFGIDLTFTQDAIEYVAEVAQNKKTGARALVNVWESILTDFQYALPGTNFTSLEVNQDLCVRPKDALLKLLKKSPFVDFVDNFKREYGIELVLGPEVQTYISEVAEKRNQEVSATIMELLSGASALNYMNIVGAFDVTVDMLESPGYFENLFTQWYDRNRHLEG